jgi:hypothetical protein
MAACDGRGSPTSFAPDLAPSVRAALDSFAKSGIDREPLGAQAAIRRGDTVEVTLTARRGLADPGKWDGPRLHVWVVGNRRIVRSAVVMVD